MIRFLLPFLLPIAMLAAENSLTSEERAAGWQLLFDGSTTVNWVEVTGLPFPTTSWKIDQDCLKAFPNPDGFQDIRTKAVYRNFDLRFDWKISPAGNSGVKYFVQKTDRWRSRTGTGFHARARGAEYQLADDETNPDAKSDPRRSTAALYSVQAASSKATRPVGYWNQSRIFVQGTHVEHWLNGVKVVEYEAKDPIESFIALQNHDAEVWFRNLNIRELR